MFYLPFYLTAVLLFDCCFEVDTKRKYSMVLNYNLTGIEEQQNRGGPRPGSEWLSPQFWRRRPVLALQPHQWLPVQPGRSQWPLEPWLPPTLPSASAQIGRGPGDGRNTNLTNYNFLLFNSSSLYYALLITI